MRGQSRALALRSNFEGDKFVTKEIRPVERRISFRDLARMAWPHKTEFYLSQCTGADPRTCKRWLADDSEPPADAAMHVINEITRLYLTRPR
jgi:hypothetical protein